MSELIIPGVTEPQISEQALGQVSSDVLQKGLFTTALSAASLLVDSELLFAEHMANIANEISVKIPINLWPKKALYTGAGLAYKAYRETGYYHSIDLGFTVTEPTALKDGVTQTYLSSLVCDPILSLLLDISSESKELAPYVGNDMLKTLGIGAGCVRFYLQQAVVTA